MLVLCLRSGDGIVADGWEAIGLIDVDYLSQILHELVPTSTTTTVTACSKQVSTRGPKWNYVTCEQKWLIVNGRHGLSCRKWTVACIQWSGDCCQGPTSTPQQPVWPHLIQVYYWDHLQLVPNYCYLQNQWAMLELWLECFALVLYWQGLKYAPVASIIACQFWKLIGCLSVAFGGAPTPM